MPPKPQITTVASRRVVKPCALSCGCRPPISGAHRCPICARTARCRCRAAARVRASACSATVRSCSERPLVSSTPSGEARLEHGARACREVLDPPQPRQPPRGVGELLAAVRPDDERLRVDVLIGHGLGDAIADRRRGRRTAARPGRAGSCPGRGSSRRLLRGGVIVGLEASAAVRRRERFGGAMPSRHHRADPGPPRVVPRAVRAARRRGAPRPVRTSTRCAPCGSRWPRSWTCTPSPRRRSSTRSCCGAARRTRRRRRSTRSATTTRSATACTRPTRRPSARREWWAAVAQTREANDEHMAEEEREGIADFRAQRPDRPARVARPPVRPVLRASTRRRTAVNVADKDPQRYVDEVERDIAQARPSDGSLGIGSLKGRRQP